MQAKGEGLKAKDAKYNLAFYFSPFTFNSYPYRAHKAKTGQRLKMKKNDLVFWCEHATRTLRLSPLAFCLLLISCSASTSNIKDTKSVDAFIEQMTTRHHLIKLNLMICLKQSKLSKIYLKELPHPRKACPGINIAKYS